MRAVLDTNVLVSALLSPGGVCAAALARFAQGAFDIVLSPSILAEYEVVLQRERFGFDPQLVEELLRELNAVAEFVPTPAVPGDLPHEDDRPFIESAVSAAADCIVTGNKRHFPANFCHGVRVLSPAEFLKLLDAE